MRGTWDVVLCCAVLLCGVQLRRMSRCVREMIFAMSGTVKGSGRGDWRRLASESVFPCCWPVRWSAHTHECACLC